MRLEEFILPTQKKLYSKLRKMYRNKAVAKTGSYILVKGEAPIMLLAHLDTVHEKPVRQICKTQNGKILMSPQGIGGDDRCGVYALAVLYRQAEIKPWLLFTCDEEIGGRGAEKFCRDYCAGKLPKELDGLKCLIEIDRKGRDDAVYYDCANDEFEDYITSKGFVTDFGSFSDIATIAPALGVAAVNLSSGYYNAHTLHEYINRDDLNETIRRVGEIIVDAEKESFPKYEYIEDFYSMHGWGRYKILEDSGASAVKRCFSDPLTEMMYEDLQYYYTVEELDAMIAEDGEDVIRMIYEGEFGDDSYFPASKYRGGEYSENNGGNYDDGEY